MLFLFIFGAFFSCKTEKSADPIIVIDEKIIVNPSVASVIEGKDLVLSAQFYDTQGVLSTAELPITWTSSDPSIATVVQRSASKNSVTIKGLKKGQVTIKAAYLKAEKTAVLNVINQDIDLSKAVSINITGSGNNLAINETKKLSATALNINSQPIAAKTFVWLSSNPSIATVDATGLVTGKGFGLAKITASVDGITSMDYDITLSKSGSFSSQTSYNAKGTVELIEENGALSLLFKNDFSINRDVDFKIHLAKSAKSITDGVNLGSLKKISGEQKYIVPNNVKINDYTYVVIWCQSYNIFIDSAKL